MRNKPSTIIYYSTIALFGIVTTILFSIFYKYHLLYIEGSQLFLFTKEYFTETVFNPGGFGEYLSRFFVQFYKVPVLGGFIISLILTSLQLGIAAIMKDFKNNISFLFLSFIPSAFYCLHLTQESFTLTGVVALSAAVWIAYIYTLLKNKISRTIFSGVAIPIVYLLFGGTTVVTLSIILIIEIAKKDNRKILPILVSAASMAVVVFTAKFIAPQMSNNLLLTGGIYFKYPNTPYGHFIVIYATVIVSIIAYFLIPRLEKWWITALITAFGLSIFSGIMLTQLEDNSENTLFYLFASREAKWSDIISNSQKHPLNSYFAANITNLALAKKDLAGDLFFTFDQPRESPFILDNRIDMIYGGEVLFYLGFINESQRYAFENMVSSPDRQKGALYVTRIAETNMIAGRNKVAKTYLNTLRHTIFYKKWAERRIELIDRPEGIDNTYYAELRDIQPKREFYFSTTQFEQAIQDSFNENKDNLVLYNYLMMSYLYNRNLTKFCENFIVHKDPIPLHFQEALFLYCKLTRKDPTSIGINFDEKVIKNYENFDTAFLAQNENLLEKYFSNSYFYYYYLSK